MPQAARATSRSELAGQRGLTLTGLLVVGFIIALAAMLVIKVMPVLVEYWTIKKAINAIVQGGETRAASVSEIRSAFDKRATIDDIKSVTAADLDVSKEGGEVVIGFAYAKKIPLFGNASLCLEFEGSTAPSRARAP